MSKLKEFERTAEWIRSRHTNCPFASFDEDEILTCNYEHDMKDCCCRWDSENEEWKYDI